ncbi:MAG: OmpA family protein [Candidatus Acidiferrales bacterium]|jgi:OmpA family protein/PEGA domain-containing protein
MLRIGKILGLAIAFALCAHASFAQDGKLKLKVTPPQGYLFVDGKAIKEGSHSYSLPAGNHTVVVVNYGYKIFSQSVSITAGKTTDLVVNLEAYGDKVPGPYGYLMIEFKPQGKAAVLLNGKKVDYFVGNVDEFNHDWDWHQELLLPPGQHQVTIMRDDKELYTGTVTVEANKKTIIHVTKNGQVETKNWPHADAVNKKAPLPRFEAGIASAQVVVAPPKVGSFAVTPAQINCSQPAQLAWQTQDVVDTTIDNGVTAGGPSGSQTVSPHATTTYNLTGTGPGGKVTSSTTLNVNTKVDATLTANPTELHYRKIGDKVITDDNGTLTWTTSNADSATLDPIGKVDLNGSQAIKADPSKTDIGPVDENRNYVLHATNVCGGSNDQTAAVHVTGSIEPIPTVLLQSVFYPTDYPDKKNPQVGLVKSQQLELATLADGFKKYLEYDPDAKLSVEAHTDVRGSKQFNQDLSERRVERIKQFLVDQGITADKIQTAAYGKDRLLDKKEVKDLEDTNPNAAPKARAKNLTGNWYAYNRRADIILLPSGQKSSMFFPNNADDSGLIWQIPKPALKKVEAAQ